MKEENKLKIDRHFHPNIAYRTKRSKQKRLNSIWNRIRQVELDGVLVCEHAFKKPKYSFIQMLKARPTSLDTFLIPWIELLSKEGIDVIVYSKDINYIYNQKGLLEPWSLKFDEIIKKINLDEKLFGIIVHPYVLSSTGIIKNKGKKYAKENIKKLGSLEVYNHSYVHLEKLIWYNFIDNLIGHRINWIKWTRRVPESIYNSLDDILLTGGSDAHHPWEIGSHLKLKVDNQINSYDDFFDCIHKSEYTWKFIKKSIDFNALQFVRSMLTVFREKIIKCWLKYTKLFFWQNKKYH